MIRDNAEIHSARLLVVSESKGEGTVRIQSEIGDAPPHQLNS
jgi:hypothetical protein